MQRLDENVDVAISPLETAVDLEQRLGACEQPVRLVHLREQDEVDHAVLVLHQQEHDPVGGGRPLPGDRQPDKQQLLAAAAKTTLVRFSLTVATQASGARLGVIG